MPDLTEIEAAEYAAQAALADAHLEEILFETPDDVGAIGVAFSLWCQLTQVLAEAGWTGEELATMAQHEAALAECEGGMQ